MGQWEEETHNLFNAITQKKDDKDKLCEIYSKFTNPHTNDYGDILTLTDEVKVEKLETNYYIYSQVLDKEAVELHKLLQKIKMLVEVQYV